MRALYNSSKKVTRKFAFLMAIALLVTTVFGNSFATTAKAADTKKKLVQGGTWTIFQYDDEEGNPTLFDVKYLNKTNEELESQGLKLQYRVFFKNDTSGILAFYSWTDITEQLTDPYVQDIYDSTEYFFIQFRLFDESVADETTLPVSYTFALYDEETPYILASNTYIYDNYYDLHSNPNEFTVVMRVEERLRKTDDLSVTVSPGVDDDLETYSASNLQFENITDSYTIGDVEYKVEYSLLTFDVVLSPVIYDLNYEYSFITYFFKINGLKGVSTGNEPAQLILSVCTPAATPEVVSVESINITSSASEAKAGDTVYFSATVLPENATNTTVSWSSSNTNYATIDANGVLIAEEAGAGKSVTITATANDGSGVSASYLLNIAESDNAKPSQPNTPNVPTEPGQPAEPGEPNETGNINKPVQSTEKKVTGVEIQGSSKTVKAGETVTLKAIVSPTDATNSNVTWKSSNEKYATVNNGVVTTKKAGAGKSVTITATAADGSGKTAGYTLKITKPVTKIKIKASTKTVKAGKKLKLKVTVKPSNATNKKVTWSSNKKKYASVNSKGVVTAKKAGIGKTVKITAKAKDGSGKKATIKITIK